MTEQQKRFLFGRLVPRLMIYAVEKGFEVETGEFYRPPETAQLYAEQGRGISNSLHQRKIACDLLLFKPDGTYLKDKESYKILGDFWKSLSGDGFECCWGGDFKLADYNHFSIEHLGIR